MGNDKALEALRVLEEQRQFQRLQRLQRFQRLRFLNTAHPRSRTAAPCSSNVGGGSRTDPGTLGATPVSADAGSSRSVSRTDFTTPFGTPAASRRRTHSTAVR